MAIAPLFLLVHMVDYAVKTLLLVCLARETALQAAFFVLLAVHVVVSIRRACVICRGLWGPCCALPLAAVLLGVATPLLQVIHLLDVLAAWWYKQNLGKRLPLRAAPLDVIVEGLAFLLTALHLRFCIGLGRLEPLLHVAPDSFETLLMATLGTTLCSVAVGLVILDSMVSLKIFRAMYGASNPRNGNGGKRCCSTFMSQVVYRGCEVAAKSSVIVALTFILQPSYFAGYVVFLYLLNVALLLNCSQEVKGIVPAFVIAWPLLFANLPQFIDSPKHYAAAQNAASLVCGLRAVELSVAVSLAAAAFLVQEEVIEKDPAKAWLRDVRIVQLVRTCQELYHRTAACTWAACAVAHYVSMAVRWFGAAPMDPQLMVPLLAEQAPQINAPAAPSERAPATGLAEGEVEESSEKEFWPSALSLANLILSAASRQAPLAWPLCKSDRQAGADSRLRSQERQPRFEDFDTIGLIGFGEFGKVFQVRRRATKQTFAMKRLSKEFYARRQMTDKAAREIATLNLAQEHPFVVRLLHAIETANEWAMVMEYCHGGDLQQLLLTEGCPGLHLQRTLRICAEVALALEHLHSRGIVFRDLKLENVVLDSDGFAKLTDFGLAKQYRGGRDAIAEAEASGGAYAAFTKTFCGSYGYAAPEVNLRREVHGFAADMYAYGVLLVMMLTGGEVYHDTREAPFERRLPPESLTDLRDVLERLSFDFYWASHHLLQPACTAHRVEIDINGAVVIVARGQRGARRQARPHRPPNSPRNLEQTAANRPAYFPDTACSSSEASRRSWDLALDLVRSLTAEVPEHRGTIARLKQHPFFEDVGDWRYVYPKYWTQGLVKEHLKKMLGQAELPNPVVQRIEDLPLQDLVPLLDEPDEAVQLLQSAEEQPPAEQEIASPSPLPSASVELLLPQPAFSDAGATAARAPAHEWSANYP
mmetsp:Transcript_70872/g.125192  ORF Transcript_70872/g.125192 Transcript_70872/m.125192 type:complete len:930 (+) Transcript_70872:155-2944(+)